MIIFVKIEREKKKKKDYIFTSIKKKEQSGIVVIKKKTEVVGGLCFVDYACSAVISPGSSRVGSSSTIDFL